MKHRPTMTKNWRLSRLREYKELFGNLRSTIAGSILLARFIQARSPQPGFSKIQFHTLYQKPNDFESGLIRTKHPYNHKLKEKNQENFLTKIGPRTV
jgi:hypothetical protein